MNADKIMLLYDTELHAPACVLLQAVAGGDRSSKAFHRFDSKHWLTHPTPGMRRIVGTDAEWEKAAAITKKKWGNKWAALSEQAGGG